LTSDLASIAASARAMAARALELEPHDFLGDSTLRAAVATPDRVDCASRGNRS
jgi:hypothetical protein